jgi:hypothetical protein
VQGLAGSVGVSGGLAGSAGVPSGLPGSPSGSELGSLSIAKLNALGLVRGAEGQVFRVQPGEGGSYTMSPYVPADPAPEGGIGQTSFADREWSPLKRIINVGLVIRRSWI